VDNAEFRRHAHAFVDWMADYLDGVEAYPVRSPVQPREVFGKLPANPPTHGEPMERIFGDFRDIILPGMTHWQNPSWFGYFPANSSPPSILAEMLTATLGAQCMSWITSPAATELEERMMEWLRQLLGLPIGFTGVLQDTASTATLCAILTAREKLSGFAVNAGGMRGSDVWTAYCSTETHSSFEKGIKIAGIGREHLRKVEVDGNFAMRPEALDAALALDVAKGFRPLIVIATLGTTGSTAVDSIKQIAPICKRYGAWLHIDAAFAGSTLLLPEYRWMIEGIETADSFVMNPHKWLMTNFDCSAYFVQDVSALVRTFEILPEYLKTAEGDRVNNYRDWGIQLGRRFRALKLWFVIRHYGAEGLQALLRKHLALAQELAGKMKSESDFQILAPVTFSLVCFRYAPKGVDETRLDDLNARLLEALNATGRVFLSHTKLGGKFALRMVIAQTNVEKKHVDQAWELIAATGRALL
jgi:aromatic-L-amino-acid/L-tryptophan decarboxylase